ncbi:MAG: hypothetical protein ACE5EH_03190 [Gammaproteobacteria bacterium]
MKSRIEDVPKLSTVSTMIDASRYNQVRLALSRIDSPLRIPLPGLRGMDMILESDAWVCVDRTLYDLPVLAWTDFKRLSSTGIHEPVKCLLHTYHIHADLITETVLSTLTRILGQKLDKKRIVTHHVVSSFPAKEAAE